MNKETDISDFVLLPASNGQVALAKKSEIVGGRCQDNNNLSILYLRSGPSLYVNAPLAQIGRYLEAEQAELGRT
jgi:hypothetical protein